MCLESFLAEICKKDKIYKGKKDRKIYSMRASRLCCKFFTLVTFKFSLFVLKMLQHLRCQFYSTVLVFKHLSFQMHICSVYIQTVLVLNSMQPGYIAHLSCLVCPIYPDT